MIKILFLIHDLGHGGAEKVLVNLVNHMDKDIFDISVTTLFGGGINERFLAPYIHLRTVFPREVPGNSKWMKLLTAKQLHKLCIREKYDIEVSYLEGPTARVVSGCTTNETKLVSWIHVEQHSISKLAEAFRSKDEAKNCYNHFHQTICVSRYVYNDFCSILNFKKPCKVLYNTVESDKIFELSKEEITEIENDGKFKLVAVGTLKHSKGYDRLLHIVERFVNLGYDLRLYILGTGPIENELKAYVDEHHLTDHVVFLGYQTNPYKYVAKCDLFVCASHAEGFSTATTEALIVGTPVCTVEVSGMKEMLGENNEYGVVTENNEEALFQGILRFIENPSVMSFYSDKALERGKYFKTTNTVKAVEEMLLSLYEGE